MAYKEEPGESCANEDFEVFDLAEVAEEVGPGGSWDVKGGGGEFEHPCLLDWVDVAVGLAPKVSLKVGICLLDIVGYVESVSWCLGDGDSVV